MKASNESKKTSNVFNKALNSMNKNVLNMAGKISPAFQGQLMKVEAGASKAFGVVQKGAGYLGKGLQVAGKAAKGLALGVGAVAAIGTAALAPIAKQGLDYASNLTEVQNVVDTTFGKNAGVIDSFAKSSMQSFGLSSLQAKNYSSVLGSMYKSMGIGSQETLTMSQNMTALSGDMASFYNLDPAEAFEKIKAGVSGETEPLKALGINMSVANLQAYALSKGMKTNYNDMTQAQQATLRYNYLLSATADAQGDFSKTSGSFANQQKLMQASLQQMSGEVMQKVIPALATGMGQINQFISSLDTDAIGDFAGQLAHMVVSFLPMVLQLMPTFGSLLQMILPPLMNIVGQLLPVVILLAQTLFGVLQPLIPPIMQFVQALLPPIVQMLTAVSPLLVQLANIIGAILGPALNLVVTIVTKIADLISAVSKPFGEFFGMIGSFLGIGGNATQKVASIGSSAKVPAYANGGFANTPSIFGEAGLEAAIPIRPGNSSSLGLLAKTAKLLGAGDRYGTEEPTDWNPKGSFDRNILFAPGGAKRPIYFTYAPVFHGEKPSEGVLKRDAQNVKRILDDYFGNKGRLAWE